MRKTFTALRMLLIVASIGFVGLCSATAFTFFDSWASKPVDGTSYLDDNHNGIREKNELKRANSSSSTDDFGTLMMPPLVSDTFYIGLPGGGGVQTCIDLGGSDRSIQNIQHCGSSAAQLSVTALNETCIDVTALSQITTDTFCAKNCSTSGDCRDIVLVFNSVSRFPRCGAISSRSLITINTPNCSALGCYCLADSVDINDLRDNYTITDNGINYAGGYRGCNFDTIYSYTYFTVPNMGRRGPYRLDYWRVNGVDNKIASFNTMQQLVDSMNVWDPVGNWQLDTTVFAISGGSTRNSYGQMKITRIANRAIGVLELNLGIVSNGIQMCFSTGGHQVIFKNNVSDCADTITVRVVCTDTMTNLRPNAVDDVATTTKNTPTTISVLSNDVQNGSLTGPVRIITQPTNGTATVTNNQIIYTPNQDVCGVTDNTLTYEICNATGCDTAQVTVTVNCEAGTNLTAVDDRISTPKNTSVRFGPLSNDTIVGGFLSLGLVSTARHGSVGFIGTDSLIYVPNTDFCGLDTIEYRLCNNSFICDTATIFITVTCDTPQTLKPNAVDDVATTPKETAVTIDVLSNDQLNGSLVGSVSVINLPQHGSTTFQNNQIIYTPDTAYCGNDAFTYSICNANGCDTATVTISVTCDTIPLLKPDAIADVATTKKNQPVTVTVLTNDILNGTLTGPVRIITQATHGTATVTGNQIIYTPNQDVCGETDNTLTYEICNANGCDTAQVTVTISCDTAALLKPDAVADVATTKKNQPVTVTVLTNDILNGTLTGPVRILTPPTHGTAVVTNNEIVYTPNQDVCGETDNTLTYEICNANGCDTAQVTVTISCDTVVPTRLVAVDDRISTQKNTRIRFTPLSNDTLVGSLLSVGIVSPLRHGSVGFVGTDSLDYIPDIDYCGLDTMEYRLCNTNFVCDTATIYITVTCDTTQTLKPDAVTDNATTKKNESVTVTVLTNDILNGTLTGPVRILTPPTHGTAVVTNNEIVYTPNQDTCGVTDNTLTYEICNANGCDTAQVIVTINCDSVQTLKPDAVTDNATTKKNESVTVTVLTNDILNGTLTGPVRILTPSTHGTAVVTNNTIVYTPHQNVCGETDNTLTYEICNANGCDTAQVIVTISCDTIQTLKPDAVTDIVTTKKNESVTVTVLTNDVHNGSLTGPVRIITPPIYGTAVVTNNTIVYTPNQDTCGVTDSTLTYEICNANGCDTAQVIVTITCDTVVTPTRMVAIDDRISTPKNTPIRFVPTTNDTLVGTLLALTIITEPRHGSISFLGLDTLNYLPNLDYCGLDTMEYRICNTNFACDTATVYITVTCDSLQPIAVTDTATTKKNESVTISVLTNDTLHGALSAPVRIITPPTLGTATVTNNQIVYTPNRDTCAFQDTLTYEICNTLGCDTAQIIVTVTCDTTPILKPIAIADTSTTKQNEPVTISVLTNDTLNNPLTGPVRVIASPTLGTATVTNDQIIYTPNRDTCGFQDTLSYEICTVAGCDTAQVIVTVNCDTTPPKLLPIALNDSDSTKVNTPIIITVLANDTLNGTLTGPLSITTQPTFGTVTVLADGSISYRPFAGYCGGNDVFAYQICNGNGCDTAEVTVKVTCDTTITQPPVAEPDVVTTRKNTPVSITILANDTINGTLDSIKIIQSPLFGTAILGSNNVITYTPDSCGFTDSLIYRICNSNGCDTALVTINVTCDTPVSKPIAVDDSIKTTRNRSVLINVVSNDSLFSANLDTISILKNPIRGSVLIERDQIRYLPQTDSCGYRDTFSYVICTRGGCDTADVFVEVQCNEDLPPVAEPDSARTTLGQAITINIGLNDSLRGADTFRITQIPFNGTAEFDTLNNLVYTPNPAFCGQDTLIYEICNQKGCDTALVTITVDCTSTLPIAVDDSAKTIYNVLVGIPITLNDTLNGTDSITVITQPTRGTVAILADKTAAYTPSQDFCGQDSFRYVICNRVGCDTATVYIEVSCGDTVIVYNGFSPNDDGKNDGFYIRGIENYPENEVVVFNRWGNEVYRKKGYRNDSAWQGTWNNLAVPDGTYFYCIYLNDSKGTKKIGYLQIMK